MSATAGDGGGEMTLAFALSALQALADPEQAMADARQWSRHLGVVANDTDAVRAFVREQDLPQDFELGDRDKWLVMSGIREWTDTDRYIYVATSAEDRRLADHLGWEFLHVSETAGKAGWELGDGSRNVAGLVARIRERLTGGLL